MRKELSYVAGILDAKGGFRVVVTRNKRDFRYHQNPGDRVFIVPGFKTPEPVPWHEIPYVIGRARASLHRWIRKQNEWNFAVNSYLTELMNPR
jgi:hypothetical protein